jgi:hypothetical protein
MASKKEPAKPISYVHEKALKEHMAAIEQLREALAATGPHGMRRFKEAMKKTKLVTVRVTEIEMQDIKDSAERNGLSMSEYLLQLHADAQRRARK